MKKTYVINIPPIAWKRAGKCGKRFFDQQSHEKLAFGLYLSQQHADAPLYTQPLMIEMMFYIAPPKTVKKRTPYVSTFPDIDNLMKFVLDAAKDILYDDDRIVCILQGTKLYDLNPRVELTVTELV